MKMKLIILVGVLGLGLAATALQAYCVSCSTDSAKCKERMLCCKKKHQHCDAKHWKHEHHKTMCGEKLSKNPLSSK